MLPLWEGYDEWAHFAVLRRMVVNGEFLVSRDAPIPRDVEASFRFAPVPWEMRSLAPPSYTEDAYWRLTEAERGRRARELRTMPAAWSAQDGSGAFKAYEALQPPLYYWTMAAPLWICLRAGVGLAGQVLALRVLSSLIASLVAPLVFLLARELWGDDRFALGCSAIVAVMPGLALDVARVGNDCLAVVLFTALTWLLVRPPAPARPYLGLATGAVLALGLLTKAYFLAAIPIVLAVSVYTRSILPGAIGLLLPSWWYIRNLRLTGTLSGLSEAVMLREAGIREMVRRAAEIQWVKAIDSILFSHLYFGGWSSLTVRSWMYHAFYVAILVAAIGLVRLLRLPPIRALLAIYATFWLAQLYNVVLLYMSKGLGGSMGWYLYAVIGAEVALCVAGLREILPGRSRHWIAPAGAIMFALLDLYTVHAVAIPYYTGMIRHRANGSLAAVHWEAFHSVGVAGAVHRLTMVSPFVLVVSWLFYLCGTGGVLMCAWRVAQAAQRSTGCVKWVFP